MPDWYVTLLCLFSVPIASTPKIPTHLLGLFPGHSRSLYDYDALLAAIVTLLSPITKLSLI